MIPVVLVAMIFTPSLRVRKDVHATRVVQLRIAWENDASNVWKTSRFVVSHFFVGDFFRHVEEPPKATLTSAEDPETPETGGGSGTADAAVVDAAVVDEGWKGVSLMGQKMVGGIFRGDNGDIGRLSIFQPPNWLIDGG